MRYYFTFYVDNLLIDSKYNYAQANLFNACPDKVLKLYELCFNSFLQNSKKECYILVNEKSHKYLKKYTNILDKNIIKYEFPYFDDYQQVWSLPKLFAYQYVCNIGDPFAFFDLDMVMVKEISEEFLSSKIFVNEFVPRYELKDWHTEKFVQHIKSNTKSESNKIILNFFERINFNFSNMQIPNCAIFGGQDLNKINNYINFAINHCLDSNNYEYWGDQNYLDDRGFSKACILEQLLLGLMFWDPSTNKSELKFLIHHYYLKKVPFPINHIAHDKYYLHRPEIDAVVLYNLLYKIFKRYTVHYTHLLRVPKEELKEFNFSSEEKVILRVLFDRFINKQRKD